MVTHRGARAALLAAAMALASAARAQDDDEERMKSDVFVVTPRLWYGTYVSPKEFPDQTQEAFVVPMKGATVTYTRKSRPDFAFLGTVLHGSGQGRLFDNNVGGIGTTSSTRTDAEFLVRYNVLGPRLYVLGGWRHVKFDVRDQVLGFESKTDVLIQGPELGVGSTLDLSRDGRHQVFGNLTGLYSRYKHSYSDNQGFSERRSFRSWGLDMNVGYQYWFSPAVNVSARYRIFAFNFQNNIFGTGIGYGDMAVFHGPEIGMSFVF